MSVHLPGRAVVTYALCFGALLLPGTASASTAEAGKVPITTRSPEALRLYLEGRDLAEKLRITDAHAVLEKAVARDPDFAMAHLALANTAPSAKAFFASLERAVELAGKVTEGERHVILGQDAGARSQPQAQEEHYRKLTAAFPRDERAHNLLGGFYFGRQQYEAAVDAYRKALELNPAFSQPYNQLGYAYRFLGRFDEAEKTFRRYVELIPDDPNPYDSYAELLLKRGRFEDAITQYRKALAVDPRFVASYVGIGVAQTLEGHPDQARATFAELAEQARNDGERRLALTRTAWSFIDAGAWGKALDSVQEMYAIAEKGGDGAALSGDLTLMGNILLAAGRAAEAAERFARAVEVIDRAAVPEDVKEATRRAALYNQARVALAKKDLPAAKSKSAAYARRVTANNVPFEVRQRHHLAGLIALEEQDHAKAVAELEQANQQDPRVSYALALAHRGRGDAQKAREYCRKAAEDNSLNFNYAYVRSEARKLLASM